MPKKKIIIEIIAILFVASLVAWGFFKKSFLEQKINLNKVVSSLPGAKISLPVKPKSTGPGFAILWFTDFTNNRVVGFTPEGKVVWAQNMSAPPIPRGSWYFIGGVERVTVAPNGNLITSYGDAMTVSEIDRQTHNLVWQYGITGRQTYRGGLLDEPHKSYKFNDHEVVINDSNDRLVTVVDQNTNQVVWQYGEYHKIGNTPGILQGNTSVLPVNGGEEFLITETLANRVILVDRATKNILWQYTKPDAKWLENVTAAKDGGFILSDRQKGEVFEVNRSGQIVWDLTKLADENTISYPTDTAEIDNGNILIDEAGRGRIVEVVPTTGEIARQYKVHGFVSTIAIDQNNLDGSSGQKEADGQPGTPEPKNEIIAVDDASSGMGSGSANVGGGQTFSGVVASVNASTGKAGQIAMKKDGGLFAVEVYNYSRVINKNGSPISLEAVEEKDAIMVTGILSGAFISASRIQDNSR